MFAQSSSNRGRTVIRCPTALHAMFQNIVNQFKIKYVPQYHQDWPIGNSIIQILLSRSARQTVLVHRYCCSIKLSSNKRFAPSAEKDAWQVRRD